MKKGDLVLWPREKDHTESGLWEVERVELSHGTSARVVLAHVGGYNRAQDIQASNLPFVKHEGLWRVAPYIGRVQRISGMEALAWASNSKKETT